MRRCVVLLVLLFVGVQNFDPLHSALTWTDKANMPTGRTYLAGAVVGDSIFCVGGYNGSFLTTNERYCPNTNNWASRQPMITSRYDLACAATAGTGPVRLFAFGGYNGSYLNVTEEYNPSTNTWASKASVPTPREGCGAATDTTTNFIYVIGGKQGATLLSRNEQYNPWANQWDQKASMPTARVDVAVCSAVRDDTVRIYAIGGCVNIAALTPTNIVEEYTPATNTWITRAPMPTARWGLGAIACCGDKIYAIGGTPDGTSEIATVEVYDIALNSWTSETSLNHARDGLVVQTLGDKLYAIGGTFSGSFLQYTEESTSPCAIIDKPDGMQEFRVSAYPNPFTQKAIIRYSLNGNRADYTNIHLTINDLSGRLIRKWHLTNYQSPFNQVVWDASNLPTGVYFLRLEANGSVAQDKLILVR